jgi:hypothetical protein
VISGARVSPSEIWPPNNKMVDVRVDYAVKGSCSGSPTVKLTLTSNEPINPSDWQVVDAHTIRVRAQRLGGGSGRIYSVVITATDPLGSAATTTLRVTVPHDMRK